MRHGVNMFKFISKEIMIFLIAALPIIELRGAIPLGVVNGMSPFHAFLISLLGSSLPIPLIFFLIRPLFEMLSKFKMLQIKIDKFITKTLSKSDHIRRYEFWGLLLFVAIPLPGTGVWTGTLAAVLLDLRFKTAFPAILLGNIIAGLIMLNISYGLGAIL